MAAASASGLPPNVVVIRNGSATYFSHTFFVPMQAPAGMTPPSDLAIATAQLATPVAPGAVAPVSAGAAPVDQAQLVDPLPNPGQPAVPAPFTPGAPAPGAPDPYGQPQVGVQAQVGSPGVTVQASVGSPM